MSGRELVVTADDFGLSRGVNNGIIHAHAHGIVTATSLMVRRDAAAEAAAMAAEWPTLALGIHLDLGEWTFDGEQWIVSDFVVDADDEDAVSREIDRQLGAFVRLTGRLPTHIDGHQHVHRSDAARDAVARISRATRSAVRHRDAAFIGGFYGQSGTGQPHPEWLTPSSLIALLRALPAGRSEIGCHPGFHVDSSISTYASDRTAEVDTLCDPAVRATIDSEGIRLVARHWIGEVSPLGELP